MFVCLLFTRSLVCVLADCCLMPVVWCLLFVRCCLLVGAPCVLFVVCCLCWFVVRRSLFVVCRPSIAVCCS